MLGGEGERVRGLDHQLGDCFICLQLLTSLNLFGTTICKVNALVDENLLCMDVPDIYIDANVVHCMSCYLAQIHLEDCFIPGL